MATFSLSLARAEDANDRAKVGERLKQAATVLDEVTKADDKGIPEDLLRDAHCAVIVPDLKKAGFIVSGKYGRGFLTCRKVTGSGWSAPAAIRIEGGGVGFQIGVSETDLVLLVMNEKGAQKLMASQFTLGAEGEVAAGPVGRNASAQTDAKLHAEILSWSRSRGVFAGASLQAATLREDKDENRAMYGKKLTTKQIVNSKMAPPAAAASLLAELNSHSRVESK
ncbi:MAG: lipid-binding SYLF domain-containing protein [Acidobacteriota bacterium]